MTVGWWRCSSRRARSRCSGSRDGLVAAGFITLAATLTRYADRADQILATTIYPAIVRVRERGEVLEELFEKANRLTLMWAFPFGAGLALFGADLIVFVLGDEWRGAIVLLGGLAVAVALQQVGYSWFAFYRARGESWPQAVESAVFGASFAVLAVPGALLWGSWGFVVGRGSAARRACWRCAPSTCGGCCRACACSGSRRGPRCRCVLASAPVLARAARAVGRRADAGAGAGRARAVARRARAGDAPARARPARRAARLPASRREGRRSSGSPPR